MSPRALVAHGHLILVADAATGTIQPSSTFFAATRIRVGTVSECVGPKSPRWRVTPTATCCSIGRRDRGDGYVRLSADAGRCHRSGSIAAGPLRCRRAEWLGTRLARRPRCCERRPRQWRLFTCTPLPTPAPPASREWVIAPSLDCLLARNPGHQVMIQRERCGAISGSASRYTATLAAQRAHGPSSRCRRRPLASAISSALPRILSPRRSARTAFPRALARALPVERLEAREDAIRPHASAGIESGNGSRGPQARLVGAAPWRSSSPDSN